jgi:hypothetical protein
LRFRFDEVVGFPLSALTLALTCIKCGIHPLECSRAYTGIKLPQV